MYLSALVNKNHPKLKQGQSGVPSTDTGAADDIGIRKKLSLQLTGKIVIEGGRVSPIPVPGKFQYLVVQCQE